MSRAPGWRADEHARPARSGPPSGVGDTRGEILDAARHEFAEKGYDGASVRGIARAASVDPALVHHFFGSKQQVFVAAMALPVDPGDMVPDVLAGDPAQLGERFARVFLGLWSNPEFREPMLGLLRSATTSEEGAAMLREFVGTALLGRLAQSLEGTRRRAAHLHRGRADGRHRDAALRDQDPAAGGRHRRGDRRPDRPDPPALLRPLTRPSTSPPFKVDHAQPGNSRITASDTAISCSIMQQPAHRSPGPRASACGHIARPFRP